MDLVTPGLPKRLVLQQIRTTNTISAKLRTQLAHLNDHTNAYLAHAATLSAKDVAPNLVEDIFRDFYYAVGIGAAEVAHIPEVPIATLQAYQKRLAEVSLVSESDHKLAHIVAQYTAVLATHHWANAVVYKTVVAKAQLAYWADVGLLPYAKIVFGVQTLPLRAYRVLREGFGGAVAALAGPRSIRLAVDAVAASFAEMARSVVRTLNANFVLKTSWLRFYKVPLALLDAEVKAKIARVLAQLDAHYEVLGLALNNLPVEPDFLAKVFPDAASLPDQLACVQRYMREPASSDTAPPGFVVRYWPVLVLVLHYGPSSAASAWENRRAIGEWVRHNFVDTAVGFWRNWIVQPVVDMANTLRNDNTMTITSKESLKLDLDSLERMVEEFLHDNHIKADPAQVRAAVAQGDLTMMMSQYENEIRTPYRLLVSGLLIRSILIQVQKTKVDGALAINGIDKLLKLQQLLFGALSILPSLFILYQANRFVRRDALLTPHALARRVSCLKSLNLVEKLVSGEYDGPKLVRDGRLFVEILNLTLLSRNLVPPSLRADFLHDLNELVVASSEQSGRAQSAVSRIWNMYSPFFRRPAA